MLRHACAFVLALLFVAAPEAGQRPKPKAPPPPPPIAPLDLARVLDLYTSGQFDQAVGQVARAGSEIGRNLRLHWPDAGRRWIDAGPAGGPQRMLAAAALALETEHLRAERGEWRIASGPSCATPCVLDWAQRLLIERGTPDAAERAWYLAAAAVAGGVRDWRYLRRPVDPSRADRVLPGLMDRAIERFPGDSQLRLEQALAAAGRFNMLVDGGRRAADALTLPLPLRLGGRGEFVFAGLALDTEDTVAGMLGELADDPAVGAEARMRLGYLHWAFGRNEAAREELAKAAHLATDTDVRYLAQFLLGWTATFRGDTAAAVSAFEAALTTRPGSQSAAVALAALELQRGDADKAHDLARTSLEQRRADADPWRLFLYGHHPQWPARIAELRRQVKP